MRLKNSPPPPPPPLAADLFTPTRFFGIALTLAWAALTASASIIIPPFLSIRKNFAYFWTLTAPVISFGFFAFGLFFVFGLKRKDKFSVDCFTVENL